MTGTEVFDLPRRYPNLESVTVYNGWLAQLSTPIVLTSPVLHAVAGSARGSRLVDKVAPRIVGAAGGPDAAERARTRTHAVAVVADRMGETLAEVHVEGSSIYNVTAELMAWAGEQLAAGRGNPGVVGPLDAFGVDDLVRGCAEIGLARV